MVTLSARVEANASVDTLNHTPSGTTQKSLSRFGNVLLPFWGFGIQVDNPQYPLRLTTEYGRGTSYNIGVIKTLGTSTVASTNVAMPQLSTDTSRFLLAAIGKFDKPLPGHLFRPALAFFHTSAKTQAYQPVEGAQSTDFARKGPIMTDTSWANSQTGFAIGLGYEWIQGVKTNFEWERTSQELSRGAKLDSGRTDNHVDHRISMGLEVSQSVIPALAARFPEGTSVFVRLGLRLQSLAGMEVEPGYLGRLTTGYEPAFGYEGVSPSNPTGWIGQEDLVGLNPQLGSGSDETAISFGFGGATLGGKLGADVAIVIDTWNFDAPGGAKLSGTGWNFGVHWSL